MEFVHQPYIPGETIAAIATPPGEGGVAIIRISGDEAVKIADLVFSGPVTSYKSHTAHFGKIHEIDGSFVDDVLLLVMRAPRSYTGENTVEIHCHGGSLITRRVLEAILKRGVRAARPGEFTFRAFMNGKLDLAQAEAVQNLIGAKNEKALDAAENQLQGRLSKEIDKSQSNLTKIAAILEAWVDFPEEGLEFSTIEELSEELNQELLKLKKLAATFHNGKILHDGLSLCLLGKPNVGKSSLMNVLLNKERAIVSPVAGTTRDVLEDHLRLNGLHIKLSDTAGIRETEETIEKEGIRRSKQAMKDSDLILLVLDAHTNLTDEDHHLLEIVPKEKTLLIWNKMDLANDNLPSLGFKHSAKLSAKDGTGLEELHRQIDLLVFKEGAPSKEEVIVTNVRHKEAIESAVVSIEAVANGLKMNISPEFLMVDMRSGLHFLGQVIGTNIGEDILTSIFSTFCIGK